MGLPEQIPTARNDAVPLAFARALLYMAHARDVEVSALLAAAGLRFNPLVPPPEPPYISVEQYSRLCTALFRAMDDESGGLIPGSPTRFGTTRLLLFTIIRCKSLADVLERAAEFNRCCREHSGRCTAWLDLEQYKGRAALNYRPLTEPPSDGSAAGMLCGLAIWLRLCSWLIGQPIDLLSARCAGPQPDSTLALRHLLHCPVSFDADYHSVSFSARHLQAPVIRSERDLAAFLSVAPYHLIINPGAGDGCVSAKIREMLADNLLEPPDFEALTSRLNMSARTLRRRLEKEGTSYQRIKDNTRRDAAITLLSRTRLPVAEIAVRVGFSDPSAFHRSFKKWTGLAPGEYR